jgi:hypothetical protein
VLAATLLLAVALVPEPRPRATAVLEFRVVIPEVLAPDAARRSPAPASPPRSETVEVRDGVEYRTVSSP